MKNVCVNLWVVAFVLVLVTLVCFYNVFLLEKELENTVYDEVLKLESTMVYLAQQRSYLEPVDMSEEYVEANLTMLNETVESAFEAIKTGNVATLEKIDSSIESIKNEISQIKETSDYETADVLATHRGRFVMVGFFCLIVAIAIAFNKTS